MSVAVQLVSQCHRCAGSATAGTATSGDVARCIQCGVTFLLPVQAFGLNDAPDSPMAGDAERVGSHEPHDESGIAWKLTGLASGISLFLNASVVVVLALIYFHERPSDQPFEFDGKFTLEDDDEFELVTEFDAGGTTSDQQTTVVAARRMVSTMFSDLSSAEAEVSLATGVGSGGGAGTGSGTGNGSGIFSTSKSANSFAYVVDASGSMRGSRMQRVLRELDRSVSGLDPRQRFFVVFFSDKPFPMMWPKFERRLVTATDHNRHRILEWAFTVQPDGGTAPAGALQQALDLQPDVVFFLTDGAIPPATVRVVRQRRRNPTIVNAICIGRSAETRTMQEIAATGGGELVVVN